MVAIVMMDRAVRQGTCPCGTDPWRPRRAAARRLCGTTMAPWKRCGTSRRLCRFAWCRQLLALGLVYLSVGWCLMHGVFLIHGMAVTPTQTATGTVGAGRLGYNQHGSVQGYPSSSEYHGLWGCIKQRAIGALCVVACGVGASAQSAIGALAYFSVPLIYVCQLIVCRNGVDVRSGGGGAAWEW